MAVPKQIRILLADDHTVMRSGLKLLLEREADFVVIGEAADGRAAIQLAEAISPDVVVMDVAMPVLNGIDAAARITSSKPKTAIVVLSMHSDESYVLRALKSGVKGYLLKDSAESDLIAAVRHVMTGKPFFSPAISNMLVQDYIREIRHRGVEDSYELLTARERELLQLMAEGRTAKEIAADLNLSAHTIDTHRANIMRKLNVNSISELILYAMRKGIIH
jgi:two-component system, NarL family, response regulator NreC